MRAPSHEDAVRAHYSRVAAGYASRRSRGLAGRLRGREWRAVLDLLRPDPGARVLDVGCGDGGFGAELAGRGAQVVGVDLVPAMAVAAHRAGARAAVADMQALCFRAWFDWVAWIGSSEFATSLDGAARGVAACLRPGGRLVLLFPRRNWLGLALAGYHRAGGVRMHLRSRSTVVRTLVGSGFEPPDAWRRCAAAWVCRARLAGSTGGRRS